MRTSRPMKHPPKPLLTTSSKSSRKDKKPGKPRQPQSAVEATGDDVYSFASGSKRAKGARHAEARLKTARQIVSDASSKSRSNGGRSRKGKARQLDGDADDNIDSGNDADDFGGGMPDLSKVKFRLGIGSDDGLGGADDDGDDEEIDSDLADTDHEDMDNSNVVVSQKRKSRESINATEQQRKRKRDVASNFYEFTDQVEINLDERDEGTSKTAAPLGKRKALQSESDSGSDEQDLDDGSDGEFILLSDMWDKPTNPVVDPQEQDTDNLLAFKPRLSMATTVTSSESNRANDNNIDDDETSESGPDGEDEDESMSSPSEVDESAADRLSAFIGRLPPTHSESHHAEIQLDEAGVSRKKRRLFDMQERTERMPESEFTVPSSDQAKLTLDLMLGGLPAEQAALLRKSLKPLASASRTAQPKGKDADIAAEVARLSASEAAVLTRERQLKQDNKLKSILRIPGALPIPLAPLHQAKVERQAAKERMNVEVKKWDETVKSMRGIGKDADDKPETRLVLPLQPEGGDQRSSAAELVAKYKPSSSLELQIDNLITATGMTQSALLAAEKTALMEALPPSNSALGTNEYDKTRIAQLRLARELMFRAERKAARVAKIKSRTFRKIAKKSRLREAMKTGDSTEDAVDIDDLREMDALDGGSRTQDERERLEMLRARERITLRHASGKSSATSGGRWSQSLRNMEGDDSIRNAVQQRADKQALLRRKIMGDDNSGDLSDNDSDMSGDSDAEESALRELENLEHEESALDKEQSSKKLSGIMGMKFMQKAMARKKDEVNRTVDDFKEGLLADIDNTGSSSRNLFAGSLVSGNAGRMTFGNDRSVQPSSQQGAKSSATVVASGEEYQAAPSKKQAGFATRTGSQKAKASPATSSVRQSDAIAYSPFEALGSIDVHGSAADDQHSNPWLAGAAESTPHLSRKRNDRLDHASSSKVTTQLQKHRKKTEEAMRQAAADARVDIDVDKIMLPPRTATPSASKSTGKSSGQASAASAAAASDSGDSDNSDNDNDDLPMSQSKPNNNVAFKQRDLVARAFADDNVVADFAAAKRAMAEADAPKEEDLTMPGWGSWAGKGVRKLKNAKKMVKNIPGIAAAERKDAKHQHLIITEKVDKKAQKYLVKDLPYPYTSVAQYEARMAMPMGAEWTTRGTFQEATMPKVITKPGVVIKPVVKPV